MDTGTWLVIALGAVGAGIAGYVATLTVRRKRLEQRLERYGARAHERTK